MLRSFRNLCKSLLSDLDVTRFTEDKLRLQLEPLIKFSSQLKLEDFGVEEPFKHLEDRIGYLSLLDHENYLVGIFIIPPGGTIPLHDHPGMCVISRVLHGAVSLTSIDWENEEAALYGQRHGGLARVADVRELEAPAIHALYPYQYNLHEFRAHKQTGCAVLDIITPQYDEDSRPCTYYTVESLNETGPLKPRELIEGQVVRLAPSEPPVDFRVDPYPYDLPE